jgi:acetylornithine deacetylase
LRRRPPRRQNRSMSTTPDVLEMTRQLIAIPSVSSVDPEVDQGNRAIIDLLAEWLEDSGFRIEVQPLPGTPRKANLTAVLGEGPGGLILAGHTDTVPYDEGLWRSDPFTLTERKGRFYGLGIADMKGFFPLVLEAARSFAGQELKEPLTVVATADEESGMEGARALVAAGQLKARYAVIGEPTGLRPVRMHKGVMWETIHVYGRSGHSSDPSLGANALEGMHRVMAALLRWREELEQAFVNHAFRVPVPTLNLGQIKGGDNPNRICAHCELQIEIRPLPGMPLEELRQALAERVEEAVRGSPLTVRNLPLFPGIPALETAADSPLVRAAEELTGLVAGTAAFGTEGPFFAELGATPVILGPGDIEQAHRPNEFLDAERLSPTVDILRRLVARFCLQGADAS